jgi:hypothetical protein
MHICIVYLTEAPTSRGTQSICIRKTNRLMLFREITSIFCENYMKTHKYAICWKVKLLNCLRHWDEPELRINKDSVRTAQETHYIHVWVIKISHLILYRGMIAVASEIVKQHMRIFWAERRIFEFSIWALKEEFYSMWCVCLPHCFKWLSI